MVYIAEIRGDACRQTIRDTGDEYLFEYWEKINGEWVQMAGWAAPYKLIEDFITEVSEVD
jgi:hypothetical protein